MLSIEEDVCGLTVRVFGCLMHDVLKKSGQFSVKAAGHHVRLLSSSGSDKTVTLNSAITVSTSASGLSEFSHGRLAADFPAMTPPKIQQRRPDVQRAGVQSSIRTQQTEKESTSTQIPPNQQALAAN